MKVTQLIDRCLYRMLAKCGIVNAVKRHRRCYPVLLMWQDITLEERVPFQEQLRWLANNRCVVPVEHAMRKVGSGTVSLTFDDGFESIFSVVFPLIDLLKIDATFYIPSRYIGRQGYVNNEQLQQMAESPDVAIGAHTRSHVRLSQLSEKEEIADQRREGRSGGPPGSCCFRKLVLCLRVLQNVEF